MGFNVEQVENVYFGREGCACGCRGNYYLAKPSPEHEFAKVNPGMVRKALKKVEAALKDPSSVRKIWDHSKEGYFGSFFVSIDCGVRSTVTVHFTEAQS
jgi:hypothetical protein